MMGDDEGAVDRSRGETMNVQADSERGTAARWAALRYERIGVPESVRWHKWTAFLPIVVLVAAAVAVGLTRTPTYTSSVRLAVQVSASSPVTLPGSITAAEQLASSYSRQIDARKVTRLTAREAGTSAQAIDGKISAAPVPSTSVMTVGATADSETEAVELANAAAAAMQRYVKELRRPRLGNEELLTQYRDLTARYQEAVTRTQILEEKAAGSPSPQMQATLDRLRTKQKTLTLQRGALQAAYTNGQRFYTAPLEVVKPATKATSDRASKLQLFIVLGFLGGAVTGAALATMRANRIAGSWDTGQRADGATT